MWIVSSVLHKYFDPRIDTEIIVVIEMIWPIILPFILLFLIFEGIVNISNNIFEKINKNGGT